MIKRIYIDNYKCFTNFECKLGAVQLLLGRNGSGKTAVFDVLEILRDFITQGASTDRAFPARSITAWDSSRNEQRFEIELEGNGHRYVYQLVIEHDLTNRKNWIKSEIVLCDGSSLYEFDGTDIHLFHDDGSSGPVVSFYGSRSMIQSILERPDSQKLTWFRRRMERVFVFSPEPIGMKTHGELESKSCDRQLHDLVSWLRHLSQESIETMAALRESLLDVIPGLINFRLDQAGETARVLKLVEDKALERLLETHCWNWGFTAVNCKCRVTHRGEDQPNSGLKNDTWKKSEFTAVRRTISKLPCSSEPTLTNKPSINEQEIWQRCLRMPRSILVAKKSKMSTGSPNGMPKPGSCISPVRTWTKMTRIASSAFQIQTTNRSLLPSSSNFVQSRQGNQLRHFPR